MNFISYEFIVFFSVVAGLYAVLGHRGQNRMLLIASYVFYGWWDWRFLSLIFISSLTDYLAGIYLRRRKEARSRKLILISSLVVNLGVLAFFKYYNFFIDSLVEVFEFTGLGLHTGTLSIILPIGISFYTFQSLSYTIDVYRGKLEPTTDVVSFFAFVSFWPFVNISLQASGE